MTTVRQDTVLPVAQLPAAVVVSDDSGAEFGVVRYGDTVIAAHPNRMSVATARAVGAALFELASEE